MFGWLRIYLRRKMAFVEPDQARAKNRKLAIIYAAFAWNVMGLATYHILKQNVPRTPEQSVDYAKLLGVQDATVMKFSGLKKVREYDFHLKDDEVEGFFTETEPEITEAKEYS